MVINNLQQRLAKTVGPVGKARPLLLAIAWRRAISRGACSEACCGGWRLCLLHHSPNK